jgi:hypothetical protein
MPVRDFLNQRIGRQASVERLGGMSVARVYRVRSAGRSVVVKTSPRTAEARFYERVAEPLRRAGVPAPRLEHLTWTPDGPWLVIEDIPAPFPTPSADSWQPDMRVMAVLARLHRATRAWTPDFPDAPPRAWTDQATETALSVLPPDTARAITPPLRALQHEAARLASGWCWISGDASPPNWGLRADGSPALFDWELFRRGVPASDLAPAVPGLPAPEQFRLAAAAYLAAWRDMGEALPWSLDELARDVAVAKVATVVMLLSAHATNAARVPDHYIAWLLADVPPWLARLARAG